MRSSPAGYQRRLRRCRESARVVVGSGPCRPECDAGHAFGRRWHLHWEGVMARLDRVKRKVVRAAVRENLDLIHGVLPRSRRQRFKVVSMAARVLFLLGLPAALFASSYMLSNVAEQWLAATRASRADPRSRPAASPFLASEVAPPVAAPELGPTLGRVPPEPLHPEVFPLALRRVVLDPGHGGDNSGQYTTGPWVPREPGFF